MNFRFSNLLGAPYRGGNLVLQGGKLFSAVGNRVSVVDLVASSSSTLPFESSQQIRTICVSPDGILLLAIDEQGRSLLINKQRIALLHHFSFKGPVGAANFSPDGRFVACAVGRILQVWRAPGLTKTVAPMQLYRTYGGCHADITSLDWSPDSLWVAVASKDLTARVFSLDPIEGYRAPTLAGHRDVVVGIFFAGDKVANDAVILGDKVPSLFTVARDGLAFAWVYKRGAEDGGRHDGDDAESMDMEEAAGPGPGSEADARKFAGGRWCLDAKHYFNRRGAKLTAADYHKATGMMVAAFSNGVFDLYEMPAFSNIQTLSVSQEKVTSLAFNARGDWLALGCASLGQLLVWEWRSETYVLKQQGHYYDISTIAYSPDGSYIATGADDAKVKLWTPSNGFCFVTFAEHTAPVTGVAFLPNSAAVVSASLDGTVRAFDLVRYRNFRTMTSPTPHQFASVAVDPSGEVVVAGSMDSFQIFVWAVKTARLLDVLAAHEGPVVALAFSPTQPLLASASWDGTVRTWDIFSGKGGLEVLQHNHDVLALAFRPNGTLLATATLDGQIYLWNPQDAIIEGTIEGRRDIAGGRKTTDRRAAGNSTSGQCFTALAFSADGSWLLAGGASKYVCLYDVAERVMLRRFQVSANRSLDGVLDQLNSRNVTDAGPLDLIQDEPSDDEDLLVPTAGGPGGKDELPGTGGKRRAAIRSRAVALSPSERSWAAATTEGLLLYSLDEGMVFDPTDLGEEVTPQAMHAALAAKKSLRALLIALRLADPALIRHVLMSTPPKKVSSVAAGVPTSALPTVLAVLAEALTDSPHLEFVLGWVQSLCVVHGGTLQNTAQNAGALPSLRALQRGVAQVHDQLAVACDSNLYTLNYLTAAGTAAEAVEHPVLIEEE